MLERPGEGSVQLKGLFTPGWLTRPGGQAESMLLRWWPVGVCMCVLWLWRVRVGTHACGAGGCTQEGV